MRFGRLSVGKTPGKGGPAKGRRRSRRLKALAVLLAAATIFELLPMGASDVPGLQAPSSLYGVNDALTSIQAEKATRYDSPEVLRETRNVLDTIRPARVEKTGPLSDYTLVTAQLPDLTEPDLFDQAQDQSALNGTSILDFLLGQPLSYLVYTDYEGCRTWSKGFLRPVLDFNLSTGSLIDPKPWVPVDADQDPSTGDSGYELRARMTLVVENVTYQMPSISPTPPFRVPGSLNFSGGLRFEVEKLVPATTGLPAEVAFLKAFMYRGLNYVWMVSFNFSDTPRQFAASILAERFRASADLLDMVLDLIANIIGIGNGTQILDVAGPYRIQVYTSPLESVVGIIGYAKAENRVLAERSWMKLCLAPGAGASSLPDRMEIWLDSPSFTTSFNQLRWTSSGKVRLDAELVENQQNVTYGLIRLHDLPGFMELRMDNLSTGEDPDGYIRFESSESIGLVTYDEYELYDGNATTYKHMHVNITDMPLRLTLTGTFDIARSSPGPIGNPGAGVVARILDNVMVRLSGKFYTIARTLRSIPDNLLNMPGRAGWSFLDIPAGQEIGAIELWLTSGPYIMRGGSFLAFYNITLPESAAPLMEASFSARLEGLGGFRADFRRGNHIDLRTSTRQPFTAVFVDRNLGSNASLELDPLPSRLVIDVDKDNRTFSLFSSDKVRSLVYLGWEGRQYLKISLRDLPTTFTVVQKPDRFFMNASEGQTVGRLEILSTDSDLYALEGNYLLTRSGPEGTMFGASLGGLGSAGYSTGPDGRLELSLGSPDPLQVYIENRSVDLRARLLVTPLPSRISFGMSNLLAGGLKVPDLMNATSLFGFSSAVFAITRLGADVLGVASQVAGFVDAQMAGIGQNSTFSITTESDTTLVGDIQKGNLTEAPWTHGITTRHVRAPGTGLTYYNTKLFLRLARETFISSRTDGDSLNLSVGMTGFHPRFDWMLFDLRGISGRDMFAYLSGLPPSLDLRLDANITQNTTYGRELVRADLWFTSSRALGPFLASIGRLPPVNSRMLLLASSLGPELDIEAYLGERFELRYRALEPLQHLFLKTSKLIGQNWRSSMVLLHDIPRSVEVAMAPPAGFDAGAAPSQMLPELSVAADADTLDLLVDLDGRTSGQRSSFRVTIRDAGEVLTGRNSGGVYRLRSSGTEEIYLSVRDLPYRKNFSIRALGLYLEDMRSLDLEISLVFGSYPMFTISSLWADSFQLSLSSKVSVAGEHEGRMMFADMRSSGGVPAGVQLFENGITAGVSRNEGHLVIPLPMTSLMWTILGG
ncbi:MAG: hypothetical protein FJ149_11230 [Euryarchaeota archaeon]|nr:hypothetical protein [Euryarchaeota archaeon]